MSELRDVFITGTGVFLPGDPVGSEAMEDYLGRVHGRHAFAERGNEARRGRPRAEPQPHPVLDEIERGAGGAFLELVGPEQAPLPAIGRISAR